MSEHPGFKGAMKCHKYKGENGTPCDCPLWNELIETNVVTQATRVSKDCLYKQLPRMLIEVIAASNRPAAAVESCRNEIASGFTKLAISLPAALQRLLPPQALLPGGEGDVPGNKSEGR